MPILVNSQTNFPLLKCHIITSHKAIPFAYDAIRWKHLWACLAVFLLVPPSHLPGGSQRWVNWSKLYFCQLICLRLVPLPRKEDKEVKLNWLSIFEGDWSLFKGYFPSFRRPGDLYICTLSGLYTSIAHNWCVEVRDGNHHHSRRKKGRKPSRKLSGLENPNTRQLSCFPTLIWLNLSILMITWPEAEIQAQ